MLTLPSPTSQKHKCTLESNDYSGAQPTTLIPDRSPSPPALKWGARASARRPRCSSGRRRGVSPCPPSRRTAPACPSWTPATASPPRAHLSRPCPSRPPRCVDPTCSLGSVYRFPVPSTGPDMQARTIQPGRVENLL